MSGTNDGAVTLGRRKQKRQGLAHDGAKDVVVQAQSGMWLARAAKDGKLRFVGSFSTRAEAEASLAALKRTTTESQPSANASVGEPQEGLQQTGLLPIAEDVQFNGEKSHLGEENDVGAVVQEAVRNLVVHVSWQSSRPPPPTHYSRANHATSAFAARVCRFGAACRRSDVSHWEDSDHPLEHPLMGQPVPQTPESGAVFRLTTLNACAHWRTKGFCLAGTACRFEHAAQARGCLLAAPSGKDKHRVRTTGGWRHRGRRNGSRGAVFRRFLIDEFGLDLLRAGSGVLDVAGGGAGGGGLAFSLLNYNAIPACVVDPRPPVSRKAVALLTYAGASQASPLRSHYDTDVTPRDSAPRYPRFIRRCVEDGAPHLCGPERPPIAKSTTIVEMDPVVAKKENKKKDSAIDENDDERKETDMNEKEVEKEEEEGEDNGDDDNSANLTSEWRAGPTPEQNKEEAALEVVSDEAVEATVNHCSVVCGLHADGATVPMVKWAIANHKPFAIVPCCVFWKSVPGLNEAGVRTHEDLLGYLQSLRPPGEIMRKDLAFDGRNTVLWWKGPPQPRP